MSLKTLLQQQLNLVTRLARLGDGTGAVRDAAKPGNVWVRLLQADNTLRAPVSMPIHPNANLPILEDTPVRVGKLDGRDVVLSGDSVALASGGYHPGILNPLDHTLNGFVSTTQLMPMLCKPHLDPAKPLYASVWPALLLVEDTLNLAGAEEINLGSFVPGADLHRYVVVCWRSDTNVLEAVASTPKAVTDPLGAEDLQEALDDRTTGAIPIWAWRLEGGQTALRAEPGYEQDMRQLINLPTSGGGGGGGLTAEEIRDLVAAFVIEGANIDVVHDDGADTLTISVSGLTPAEIGGFNEAVDDRVAALLVEGAGIDLVYDDGAATLTVSATGPTAVAPSIVGGRLSLSSSEPVPIGDVSNQSTLYYLPYTGNQIALWNPTTSAWQLYTIPDAGVSLVLPSTQQRLYDIFLYDNTGTLTLETVIWNEPQNRVISGVTNASPPVVTFTTSHTMVVNDLVTIKDVVGATGVNGTWRVRAVGATTITLENLDATTPAAPGVYTSGGVCARENELLTRATALAKQNGVYVKSGTPARRYMGSIKTGRTNGASSDSRAHRLLWNAYNRVRKWLRAFPTPVSWTYSTNAYRFMNNDAAVRVNFVLGLPIDMPELKVLGHVSTSGTSAHNVAIALASTAGTITAQGTQPRLNFGAANQGGSLTGELEYLGFEAGSWSFQARERGGGVGTQTWGNTLESLASAGLIGAHWC
jgi:hypothetical protein